MASITSARSAGTRGVAIVAGCAGLVLAGGAVALAQIPSQDGVISTCYSRSGGALRVIDEGTPCKSNENRLTWNQQGRPGAQGETGAQGPAGPMGPAGANGADGADGADGPTGATGAEGPVGPAGAAGPAGPAAERLFASVSTDGTLVSGTAIASSKTEVGAYTVTFGREVRGCAGVANIGFAHGGSGSVDATGLVTQVDVGVGNPNVVHVRHYDNDPTFFDGVDESFHLVVVC